MRNVRNKTICTHTSCKAQTKNVRATVISQHVIAPGRFAKDWECSFDKGWTSVRTDPNKLVQHPVTLSRAFCNRFCLRKSILSDGQCESIASDTADMRTNCGKVRAQAELMEGQNQHNTHKQQNNQTAESKFQASFVRTYIIPSCRFWVGTTFVSIAE